ncbi:MAG: DEAD/DEAH box helicase [Corynebacteriales bacterium]|nr:DEAD/DEAH box helicase [Mycobacteriales bacterium]
MPHAVLERDQAAHVSFADLGLAPEVVRILTKNGLTSPFPIQAAAIPDALSGRDVLGQGRTGSGKTLTFGLALLTRLAGGRTNPKRPRGLILSPTRELAMQISDALEPYASVLGLRSKVVCGGTSMPKQMEALRQGVDILVATPGRLGDLLERRSCFLDEVEITVLDEADQMADMGFLPEVSALLDLIPSDGQRMLFSATLGRGVDTLVHKYLNDPVRHSVDPAAGVVTTMTHHQIIVKPRDKHLLTAAIAGRQGRAIAFVRTQLGAERVAEQLQEVGVKTAALHGGMNQAARTKVLAEFKEGQVSVLVATDVAARGIDVDGIGLVLNVDPAGEPADYLHRSGRTARAGRSGIVVTLVLPHQQRSVDRLLGVAGVKASAHTAHGTYDETLAALTGAKSISGIHAATAQIAVMAAEREVQNLAKKLEDAKAHVETLRKAAQEQTARAEAGIIDNHRGERPRYAKSSGSRSNSQGRSDRNERSNGHRADRTSWDRGSRKSSAQGGKRSPKAKFTKHERG